MRAGFPNRVVLAGLIAPLTILFFIPAADLIVTIKSGPGQSLRGFWRFALALLPCAYGLMLVIGVPSFLFLRRRNLASAWTAAAIGFLAIWVFSIALALLASWTDPHPKVTYWAHTFYFLRAASLIMIPFALIGMAVGVVFWMIAKTPGNSAKNSN